MQNSVFVDVVQRIEEPKGIGVEILAAVVGLKPLNLCLSQWVHAPSRRTPGL